MRQLSVSAPCLPHRLAFGLLSIVGLLAAVLGAARAESLTVYRCVGADGAVALQDQPCPPETDSEQRRYTSDSAAPATSAVAAPPASAPPQPTVQSAAPPTAPPAARWRCVDLEGQVRIAERYDPRGRWVPAWTVGLSSEPTGIAGRGGRPAPRLPSQAPPAEQSDSLRRAQPLVYVEDRCRPMSLAETCQHLRDELSETQRQRFNQQPSGRAESDARIEQLRDALSGC